MTLPTTLYVDPGVSHCALAELDARRVLIGVWWYPTARGAFPQTLDSTRRAVVELPRIRPKGRGRQSNARPQDLIDLAAAGGRVAGNLPVRYIAPEDWKGQIPCTCDAKHGPESCPHHRRMLRALAPYELVLVQNVTGILASELHNVYDAVTMGLKLEGRLNGRSVGK